MADEQKQADQAEVKEFGGLIAQTNRMYVELKAIGQLNAKGRSVFSMGFKGRNIAAPDKPMQDLAAPFVAGILDQARYTDQAAAQADVDAFLKSIDGMTRLVPVGTLVSSGEMVRGGSDPKEVPIGLLIQFDSEEDLKRALKVGRVAFAPIGEDPPK